MNRSEQGNICILYERATPPGRWRGDGCGGGAAMTTLASHRGQLGSSKTPSMEPDLAFLRSGTFVRENHKLWGHILGFLF